MYDIDIALSWEFRELIARESETILPFFLSYSSLSSSLLFGIKCTKPFTGLQLPARDCCVIWFDSRLQVYEPLSFFISTHLVLIENSELESSDLGN